MTAFQIILIILAVILLLIFIILMLPVRLILKLSNKQAFFCIKLWFYTAYTTKKPKKRNLQEVLEKALVLLKILLPKFKIDKIRLGVVCASEDAANTAMSYGILCSTLYGVGEYLKSLDKFSKTKIGVNVDCDFMKEQSEFDFELVASIRVIFALTSLFKEILLTMNTITEDTNSDK